MIDPNAFRVSPSGAVIVADSTDIGKSIGVLPDRRIGILNPPQTALEAYDYRRSLDRGSWSPFTATAPIVAWYDAEDQPIGAIATLRDHRRGANSFSRDPLNYTTATEAYQLTTSAQPSCVLDGRGKKVIRFTGLETSANCQFLHLPSAVVAALNGTAAGFGDCTVVVFGRMHSRTSNTILGTQANVIFNAFGGTTGAAGKQLVSGRLANGTDFAMLGSNCATIATMAPLSRPFPRADIWGGRLPFANDTGLSTDGAENSSCNAFVFGPTTLATYFNGFLTASPVPGSLGIVNYDSATLGFQSLQSYADIEKVIVFGGSLSRDELLNVENWCRENADRSVIWVGGNFPSLTYEQQALTAGNTQSHSVSWYVEQSLSSRYQHINLTGSALSTAFDALNNWERELEWRVRPGDVVVLWLQDGSVDATYDPLITDRAPEVIAQLKELCRRIKMLGGVPVVVRVPPWGSFYNLVGPILPSPKMTMLEDVNAYIASHPAEFSTGIDGCPDLDLPQFNPAIGNVPYYGGGTSEAGTTLAHQLMAPILANAIATVAPVLPTNPDSSVANVSPDYPNQGSYLFYADETGIANSGAIIDWIPREGPTLVGAGGTGIDTWPLLATQTGLAIGQRHAISMIATSSIACIDNAFNALDGFANSMFAVEFEPLNAMVPSRVFITLRSTDVSSRILLSTRVTSTGGLCLDASRYQGTGGVTFVTISLPELPLNVPTFIAIASIDTEMYVLGIDYSAIVPDYWIVSLGSADISSVHPLVALDTFLLNGFAGSDGIIANVRRLAVRSPRDLDEVKNLLRFWSARP